MVELNPAGNRAGRPNIVWARRRRLADVTMPVELPDEMARRVRAIADARHVRPEQVVIEAVLAEVGSEGVGASDNPFASVGDELRRIVFDGTLRSDIDSIVDDPALAVE